MTPKGLLFFLMLVGLMETSWGQKASNWRVYKVADGMPDSTCISLSIGPQGKVAARHYSATAVSVLDGFGVQNIPLSAAGNGRVYGGPGGRFWTLAPEGLLELTREAWEVRRVPEIAAEFQAGRLRVVEPTPSCRLYPARQGLVLVLLQDRLLEINCEDPGQPRTRVLRAAAQTQLQKFSSLALSASRDGGLWVAGARGLAKIPGPVRNCNPETAWREYPLPEALQVQNLQEPHEDEDGNVTAVAESTKEPLEKVIVHLKGQQWTVETVGKERLRQAWRGPDKSCWAFTAHALYQWEEGGLQLVENEEISARQYFDVAVEPGGGGAFWLATSEGLFRYAPLPWRSPGPVHKLNASVHCMVGDQEGRLWFVAGSGLHVLQNGSHQEYPFAATSTVRSLQARALFRLKDGKLLLVSEPGPEKEDAGDQLFAFEAGSGAFIPVSPRNRVGPLKALGLLKDGSLCLQRSPGVSGQSYRLEKYDGERFEPLPVPCPDALLGSNLLTLFTAQTGELWVSAERGTAYCRDNKWRTFVSSDNSVPEAALCFAELADGKIWCATRDQIWEFDGRGWSSVRRGFDRINALVRARDGSVWVGSNSGLHRFFQGAWVENGVEEGLPSLGVREVYEEPRGGIWAGTTHGLSLYHPAADRDPPETPVQVLGETENVPEGGTVSLMFSGHDKWKYTFRERLLYSYRVDEHDWSSFREMNGVSFTDLPAGKHYFQVRVMDRNCNISPKPAQAEFSFILPWYKEMRLLVTSVVGLTAALFFAALAFNRHRQLVRSYAEVERKVTERTKELELTSRELLHSQKMNALGTLAAGIAHDFNNILSIIKGSAQIIEDNLDNPEKVRTRVDRITTVVEQGSGIVKAMLGFSRDSSGQQPSLCDLNSVAEDTIKLLGDRFLREVKVSFEPAPALPQAPGSKDFIQQILLNFIFNAAESMPKRKQILLATGRVDQLSAGLVLTPDPADAYVSISVQDFGCGILPENLPRIFEPFFTTKSLSVRRGTGLGLSMAYELAKKMGAGLAVESVVEQGSTFTLLLPVRGAPAPGQDQTI